LSKEEMNIEEYINNIDVKLLPMIKEYKCIVSGSTAMYYYMKENGYEPKFIPNDLDIFIDSKNINYNELGNYILKEFNIKINENSYENYRTDLGIGYLNVKIEINNSKIDLIMIDETYYGLINNLNNNFDFDICKCYYDGDKLQTYDKNIFNNKIIYYPSQIFGRLNEGLIHEINSYEPNRRNFLDSIDWYNFNDYMHNKMNRIIKYNNRGFKIKIKRIETRENKNVKRDYYESSFNKWRLKEIHREIIEYVNHPSRIKINLEEE